LENNFWFHRRTLLLKIEKGGHDQKDHARLFTMN